MTEQEREWWYRFFNALVADGISRDEACRWTWRNFRLEFRLNRGES